VKSFSLTCGAIHEKGVSIVMVTHRLEKYSISLHEAVILRNGESVADVDLKKTDINKIVYYMTANHLNCRKSIG
jgi:ABC-type uncharacterized transport system ATPase subunit